MALGYTFWDNRASIYFLRVNMSLVDRHQTEYLYNGRFFPNSDLESHAVIPTHLHNKSPLNRPPLHFALVVTLGLERVGDLWRTLGPRPVQRPHDTRRSL